MDKKGWNWFNFKKSDFSSTGSPAWSSIDKVEFVMVASSSMSVIVDDMRLVADNQLDLYAVNMTPVQVLGASYRLKYVNDVFDEVARLTNHFWYISENRNLHYQTFR